MFHRPQMLILTVKTGGGHISIAEALRDQFQDDYAITACNRRVYLVFLVMGLPCEIGVAVGC